MSSLTAKVLCRKHNNSLSSVDKAGIDAFQALREYRKLNVSPYAAKSTTRLAVDGPLFERWVMKTGINTIAAQGMKVADGQINLEPPAATLVRPVFGETDLEAPFGLYHAAVVGEPLGPSDELTIGVLVEPHGLVGFTISIEGIRFLLWLLSVAPRDDFELPELPQLGWTRSRLTRHMQRLEHVVERPRFSVVSHYIAFSWPP
jgi:hypothetical protein